jgi:hypothetical protein
MICADCGKEINEGVIAFCSKCKKYYCMDCAGHNHNHINLFHKHRLHFYKNNDGVVGDEINVGIRR